MAGKQKKVKKITKINPVKPQVMMQLQPTKRVCAYCRVSTDSREQQNSFIAQTAYYEEVIGSMSEFMRMKHEVERSCKKEMTFCA